MARSSLVVIVAALAVLGALAAVADAQNFGRAGVSISRPTNMNPQGLDYIPGYGFVVSSLTYGKLYFFEDTNPVQIFSDAAGLTHTTGLRVDNTRKLVNVANVDWPYSRHASIVSVSRKDGKLRNSWDLSDLLPAVKPKFVSDLKEDSLGNIYATDSLNGAIYKADRNGEASVFLQRDELKPQDEGGRGVNGIEYLSEGFLLLSRAGVRESTGGLFRASLSDKALHRLTLNKGNFTGGFGTFDSMVINPRSGRLFVAGFSDNTIYEFESTDTWWSATLVAQYPTRCAQPVALQYVQSPYNDVYVLCNSGTAPYLIQRVQVAKINIIPFDNTITVSSAARVAYGAVVAMACVLLAVLM